LTSSLGGFAFSAICGAMLFHLVADRVQVVQIMIVCSIAIQALMVWTLRRAIGWQALPAFLAGGVFGLPLGVYWLLHADHDVYTKTIGALILVYGAYMLFRRPIRIERQSRWRDAMVGVLGGVTGGLTAFPGAFVTIWCATKGWDREHQRGVYQPFILIMQVLALLAIRLMRPEAWSGAQLTEAISYLPAALLGAAGGIACYRKFSDRQFAMAVNVLLIISGCSLVF
jgi:uncharacterized protein